MQLLYIRETYVCKLALDHIISNFIMRDSISFKEQEKGFTQDDQRLSEGSESVRSSEENRTNGDQGKESGGSC